MVTYNIKSLFTIIPIEELIAITERRPYLDNTLAQSGFLGHVDNHHPPQVLLNVKVLLVQCYTLQTA